VRMRFLIDENLSPDLIGAIKQLDASIDIKFVRGPDAPLEGTLDPDILLFCEAERRALITNNRTSMPAHERDHFAVGRRHYGVFWLRAGFTYSEYAEAIHLLWAASEAEEWVNRTDWIPWAHR
jgi:Domain of unknown function (DUF5615)